MTEGIILWFLLTVPVDMREAKFVSQHSTADACYEEQLMEFWQGRHTVCHKLVIVAPAPKPKIKAKPPKSIVKR